MKEQNTELEYKFLKVNVEKIIRILEENNAKFVFDTVYKIYNHDKPEWRSYHGRVRLREGNGKTTMAYKAKLESGFDSEIEFEIEDIEKAYELINAIGIPLKRSEQKRRIRYILDSVEIDIDFWPELEPYIEIEGNSEGEIKAVAETLGLDIQDGVKLNAGQIYTKVMGKKVPSNWVFEKDDWRLDSLRKKNKKS